MPYQIIRQDITRMQVDAIVNPTDPVYSGSGGLDARIHFAAGTELRKACDELPLLEQGAATVTESYQLPCKYIIHTVGPVWHGGDRNEHEKLVSCYRSSLKAAYDLGCETIAFPLIASGTFGYPKDRVMRVALEAISAFLMRYDMMVYIVLYDNKAYEIGKKLQKDIDTFIDEHYIARHDISFDPYTYTYSEKNPAPAEEERPVSAQTVQVPSKKPDLGEMLAGMDETFSSMLLRLITESGMTDAECYKKANIDKKLFSKIRSNNHYQPTKPTVLAFAIALRLSLEETKRLLEKAGLALSHNSQFDVIVEYFITSKNYDIFEINEVLYQYEQKMLGNVIA